ncbi:uncharacterized protein LOC123322954 [Coccinella septempunctata]|uniref:uncharacterized protein LOC123322954 n=1 Tax=Coccinella septempunctata TaxID=41139 RepID=UPI001D078C4A|nr:uncharacterized protein LOC123322954 [Coccinella septempunctata]
MSKLCVVKSCPFGRISSFETCLPQGKLSFFKANTPGRIESWSKALEITLKPHDLVCQLHFKSEHINMYNKIVIKDVVHLHELHRNTQTRSVANNNNRRLCFDCRDVSLYPLQF